MQPPKTTRPAIARRDEPTLNCEQLRGRARFSDTPKASEPQAPPDNRGEDDATFFSRRPSVNSRVRLPFKGEFPDDLLKPGAFVHVLLVTRDPLTNEPRTRARAIFYSDIEGGNA